MSRQHMVRLLALVVALSVSGVAQAKKRKQHKYVGGHPLAKHGYCHIEAPHVHVYAPARGNKNKIKLEYRIYDDQYHFVGDPVARGYDGAKHSYYGHHPIAVDVVAGAYVDGAPHSLEYCYLDGPHFHAYAPPADISFEVKGGVHWYVGTYPPQYEQDKRVLVKINPLYARVEYARPVVEVDPPEAYVGPIVEVHAPIIVVETPSARAEVRGGIEVDVRIPTPSLRVEVGIPGVIVVDDHHRHRKARKRKHEGKHYKGKHKKRKHKIKSVWGN